MNNKILGLLSLGLLLSTGTVGVVKAMAQGSGGAASTAVQQQGAQDPSYRGSAIVDENKNDGQSEQAESKALSGLAKITADQAKRVAEAKLGGTATEVELGTENGTLVYEMLISNQEVKVDAGNGSVLKVQQADNEKAEGNAEKDGVDR